MRQIRRREGLGGDTACLEKLERDLSCRRELRTAAHDEHAAGIRERDRDARDARLDGANELRHRLGDRSDARGEDLVLPGRMSSEQTERSNLVRVGLRRGDRLLVARPKLDDRVGLSCELRGSRRS